MIYFLFGEDTYRSGQKVKTFKDKFLKASQNGELNFSHLKDADLNLAKVKSEISTMPFLNKTRLVLLENALSKGKKEFKDSLAEVLEENKVPESTVLLIWEKEIPDKRIKLFKFLNKSKTAEEFDLLTGLALTNYVKELVAQKEAKINSEALGKLIQFVGSDLNRIDIELEKLALYKDGLEISVADVEKLVAPTFQENIFAFTDALGRKNKQEALTFLHTEMKTGKHELYMMTMIQYQLRNLLIVKDLQERGVNEYQIAREAKLHPFVVKKSLEQTRNFSSEELKQMMEKLYTADEDIKNGKQSGLLALDIFVTKMCS
ncbi:MAG: DNA polymerase III subunit delta [bacterium]